MKHGIRIIAIVIFVCSIATYSAFCDDNKPSDKEAETTLNGIMSDVEERYSGIGFSAKFDQRSTIKAMDITDTANGSLLIKRPGMMRWEYEVPEKQSIITDGETIWVYRPEDNQVMTGKAPDYFGGGKGAGFLSDIRLVRKKYDVTLENKQDPNFHILKLIPKEKKYDVSRIFLSISKTTYDVLRVVTYNSYEDETVIELSNFKFDLNPDNEQFKFTIPAGVDVLQMEE